MKKLIMLILILLPIFNCFSQNVMPKAVRLNEGVAKLTVVDLIVGDLCQEEKKALKTVIFLTEKEVANKDLVIKNLNDQKIELKGMMQLKDQEIEVDQTIIKNNEKLIRKSARKNTFYKWIAYVSLATVAFLGATR